MSRQTVRSSGYLLPVGLRTVIRYVGVKQFKLLHERLMVESTFSRLTNDRNRHADFVEFSSTPTRIGRLFASHQLTLENHEPCVLTGLGILKLCCFVNYIT